MAIRKNKKFIDPRYFLHETTYRDEIEEGTLNSEWDNFPTELPPKELLAQVVQDKGEEWYRNMGMHPRMIDLINNLGPRMKGTQWYDPNDLEKYGLADHPAAIAHVKDWSKGGSYYRG